MFKKKEIFNILFIVGLVILIIFMFTKNNCFYGSSIDWINQHSSIPEYFRTRFYATGEMFPQFAPQLGAGQNIYNFSYYGLLSPVIMFSYLLPFVPMTTYIAVSTVILVIVAVILNYVWFRSNMYGEKCSVAVSVFMLCASPILFHSHRHIMFINYMPFLILSLMGVDRLKKKGRSGLLIISVFLMIMTSFYYSVGGICCISIYMGYLYISSEDSITLKSLFREFLRFGLRILVSVCMACILLLPTIMAILSGRTESGKSYTVSLSEVIIPTKDISSLLYSTYGLGFTAISVAAIVSMFFIKNKSNIYLGVVGILLPSWGLIRYVLNGGMYLNGKVLIPFVPIVVLIIAEFIQNIDKINLYLYFVILVVAEFVIHKNIFKGIQDTFIRDCICVNVCITLYMIFKIREIIYIPSILCCFFLCCSVNSRDSFVSSSDVNDINSSKKMNLVNEILSHDTDDAYRFIDLSKTRLTCNKIYRSNYYKTSLYSSVYNQNYNKLFTRIFSNANPSCNNLNCTDSSNILFSTLMGVKYAISDGSIPDGFECVKSDGKYSIYENKNVFSIGYSMSSLMSLNEFNSLRTQEQSIAMIKNIIVDKELNNRNSDYLDLENVNIPLEKNTSSQYIVNSNKTSSFIIPLTDEQAKKILIVDIYFEETPKSKNIKVTVNDILNVLSSRHSPYPNKNYDFRYVVSGYKGKNELKLSFSAGNYIISDIKLHSLSYSDIENAKDNISMLVQKKTKSSDVIEGSIDVKEDGYFTFTIPNSDGFTAYVDGKKQKIETVNTSFIGFPISKGNHTIKLVFEAPLSKEGKVISVLGAIAFIAIILFESKKSRTSI